MFSFLSSFRSLFIQVGLTSFMEIVSQEEMMTLHG